MSSEETSTKQAASFTYCSTLKMEATWSSETSVDFHPDYMALSQEKEFFITTAVRISNSKIFIPFRICITSKGKMKNAFLSI
jgi:hypothetical protein